MYVVALAVQLYQLGLEVGADLGEDRSECFDSMAIKDAVAAFGDKDQMNVHCRSAMPAVSKVLDFVHGPDNNEYMDRRQAFRFQFDAQRRTATADAVFRWLCSLCLQQSTGAQERTVREERTAHSFPTGQTAGAVEAGNTVA